MQLSMGRKLHTAKPAHTQEEDGNLFIFENTILETKQYNVPVKGISSFNTNWASTVSNSYM
jgi:ectoine hydroxylase-related dioxygenase (phytanoyl-CoA dioxygenase family)